MKSTTATTRAGRLTDWVWAHTNVQKVKKPESRKKEPFPRTSSHLPVRRRRKVFWFDADTITREIKRKTGKDRSQRNTSLTAQLRCWSDLFVEVYYRNLRLPQVFLVFFFNGCVCSAISRMLSLPRHAMEMLVIECSAFPRHLTNKTLELVIWI